MRVLIEHGADVRTPNKHRKTPFWLAVERRNIAILEQLIVKGIDPAATNKTGSNAFFAIERPEFVKNNEHRHQEWQLFQWLLKHNVDPLHSNFDRKTVLHGTCNTQIAKALLHRGIDVNSPDREGNTALHYAVIHRGCDVELVKTLVDAGAAPTLANNLDITPLHNAMANRFSKKKAEFLSRQTETFDMRDQYGHTLLHSLARNRKQLPLLELVLKKGTDPNAQDDLGCTPLHIAVSRQYSTDIVKTLLKHNADPNIQNNKGQTTLHMIAALPELTKAYANTLLKAGAKRDITDAQGFYPYQIAELSPDNGSATGKLKGRALQKVAPPHTRFTGRGGCR